MIPTQYITFKEELGHKINELKLWLSQKEAVEYSAYLKNGGNERTAKDKVIGELKINDEGWMEKEETLKALERRFSSVSFCLETLQKTISSVSAGVLSVENYEKWVEEYSVFFRED